MGSLAGIEMSTYGAMASAGLSAAISRITLSMQVKRLMAISEVGKASSTSRLWHHGFGRGVMAILPAKMPALLAALRGSREAMARRLALISRRHGAADGVGFADFSAAIYYAA